MLGQTPGRHGITQWIGGSDSPGSWYADSTGGFSWANNLPGDGSAFAGEYLTDRLTRDAVGFVNETTGRGDSFFLNVSHYGVHTPINAPTALRDKYLTKLNSGNYDKFNGLNANDRNVLATYAAMVETVDNSLGAVRTALVANGVDDNTTIAFISDHGGLATSQSNTPPPNLNGPLRNGKGTLYEGGIPDA